MKFTLVATALVACITGLLLLAARSERITIRVTPRAGQTIHYLVTEEFTMDTTVEGDDPGNEPIGGMRRRMNLGGKTEIAYTFATGAANPQGQIPTLMTYEHGTAEMSSDGKSAQENAMSANFAGKVFTVAFDADGGVLALTAPGVRDETLVDMKLMIASIFRYIPPVGLSVGETVAQPLMLAVPVTLLPRAEESPLDFTGRLTLKLVSLQADGAHRIAHCEQTYDVTVGLRPDATATSRRYSRFDLRVRGSRKVQINLNRGMMKASQMETTFELVDVSANSPAVVMKTHGVMKATVSGK